MAALMAVASATPVYMVAVRQAGSPSGLVITSSAAKTDLVGCDSSTVSAAHTASSADGFSGPCVPAGARSAISADEAGVHDTHEATDTTGCRRTDTTGVASTACEPAHRRPLMVSAAVQMDPAGRAQPRRLTQALPGGRAQQACLVRAQPRRLTQALPGGGAQQACLVRAQPRGPMRALPAQRARHSSWQPHCCHLR